MDNSYYPNKELKVFLEKEEVENLPENPLEMNLMYEGNKLSERFTIKFEDFEHKNKEVIIDHKYSSDSGYSVLTSIEILINSDGLSKLKTDFKIGPINIIEEISIFNGARYQF